MTRMNPIATAALVFIYACVLGCSEPESPPPPPVNETIFGDTVNTMDRARAVEDVTLQSKENLDRAIEASEGR